MDPADIDASAEQSAPAPLIGYVLKMYPRFSETFVVSEILAREAAGERIVIFSLRPPADARFHAELARVQAPVIQIPRASSARSLWEHVRTAVSDPAVGPGVAAALEEIAAAGHDDAQQALDLARLAAEHGITHLHAHFASVATTVSRLASRITGIPYSFTAHAKDIFHESVVPDDLEQKLRDAHHAVTISTYNLEHLRAQFGPETTARLHLVRNGLATKRFAFTPPQQHAGPPRLIGVGRLVEKKGFSVLLDALALLRDQGVPARLDIVGDGPLREDLAAQIIALGLEDRAQLLGPRTQTEMIAMVAGADLFVGPFVVGADGNADGLPTVLLEAMALGTPVVAADVTAVGEVVREGETGRLVPSGDARALAGAILASLEAPEAERDRLRRAARALIEQEYSSRLQAQQLQELTRTSVREGRAA